ncbi:hypothetical protein [Marinagarivorans algicola]|uniref:hypothetical protein n=1 Tax=Marinagarivorans algicola TaxID=1513270 RepID=UPI0012E3128A|nr:hypothetical protein [Marinagarivorans algicola]
MSDYTFPEIDTSYWKLNDKAWVAERKAKWATIEPMFKDGASKSKKGLGIIKKYFLKGIMPDFKALYEWRNTERHLDLFCFLWLHPSNDKQVLTILRNTYVNYPLIDEWDITVGVSILLDYVTYYASCEYSEAESVEFLSMDGQGELLFDLVMGDLSNPSIPEQDAKGWSVKKWREGLLFYYGMTDWLGNEKSTLNNEQCLYQSDLYLDYWYKSCSTDPAYFTKPKHKRLSRVIKLALYRIHDFDTEREGDSPRSRFVIKMRKILDERDFIHDFKQMWLGVKSGEIVIENAWDK